MVSNFSLFFFQTFGIPLSQYEALVNSVDQNDSLHHTDAATAVSLEAATAGELKTLDVATGLSTVGPAELATAIIPQNVVGGEKVGALKTEPIAAGVEPDSAISSVASKVILFK